MMMRRLPPLVVHWFRNAPELTRRGRDAEVASVRGVEHVGAELQRARSLPMRVFLMIPKSRLPMPSARRMLRPALPKRSHVAEPQRCSGRRCIAACGRTADPDRG